MLKIIIPVAIVFVLVVALRFFEFFWRGRKPIFDYGRKEKLMTDAEHECYNALVAEMGADYYFFPQIHLDAIVFSKGPAKSRLYAFRHINQKSVDFVACSKADMKPLFAIELDDKTHKHPSRMDRDKEVERILRGAGIPLIRIDNRGRIDPKALVQMVKKSLLRVVA
jgi:hypothetical protein